MMAVDRERHQMGGARVKTPARFHTNLFRSLEALKSSESEKIAKIRSARSFANFRLVST
jgi:hypothetical protein